MLIAMGDWETGFKHIKYKEGLLLVVVFDAIWFKIICKKFLEMFQNFLLCLARGDGYEIKFLHCMKSGLVTDNASIHCY